MNIFEKSYVRVKEDIISDITKILYNKIFDETNLHIDDIWVVRAEVQYGTMDNIKEYIRDHCFNHLENKK